MDLETILTRLDADTQNKITRTSKQRIQESIDILGYTHLTKKHSMRLQHVRARLDRRDRAGLSGYRAMTDSLDDITSRYFPDQTRDAYEVLTNSRNHYTTRFDTIHEKLNSGISHTDAAHCLDFLESSSYLKKKVANNSAFKQQYNTLTDRLNDTLQRHEKQVRRKHRWKKAWKVAKEVGTQAMYLGYGLGLGYFAASL